MYIGQTVRSMAERLAGHKRNYERNVHTEVHIIAMCRDYLEREYASSEVETPQQNKCFARYSPTLRVIGEKV